MQMTASVRFFLVSFCCASAPQQSLTITLLVGWGRGGGEKEGGGVGWSGVSCRVGPRLRVYVQNVPVCVCKTLACHVRERRREGEERRGEMCREFGRDLFVCVSLENMRNKFTPKFTPVCTPVQKQITPQFMQIPNTIHCTPKFTTQFTPFIPPKHRATLKFTTKVTACHIHCFPSQTNTSQHASSIAQFRTQTHVDMSRDWTSSSVWLASAEAFDC